MEKRFNELDLQIGFVLDRTESLNYLDYVARQRVEQVLSGESGSEGMTEFMESICEMKKSIVEHNCEFVKFIACQMSSSGIDFTPMIEENVLRYTIGDVAEWVLNNLDDPVPLIFESKKEQALLERYVKGRKQVQ